MRIRALKNKILITDLERGIRMVHGIIIPNDNGKSEGIRPRWGKIYSLGEDIKDISVGQWILIENGRWTRMLQISDDDGNKVPLWGVDPESILLVSDEEPDMNIFSKWG